MKQIEVIDFMGLENLLKDTKLMAQVYKHFIPGDVVSAEVKLYKHSEGSKVKGLPGRYWVYVHLRNTEGIEYDVALWKILKEASLYPDILKRLYEYIELH